MGENFGGSAEIAGLGVPARLLERMAFALLKENWGDFAGQTGDLLAAMVETVLPR